VKYITALVIWLLFVLAQVAGFALGLGALLLGKTTYAGRVARAQDRATAAVLGWDGNSTVSKECGRSECRFCKILCAILNVVLEPGHCKKEVE